MSLRGLPSTRGDDLDRSTENHQPTHPSHHRGSRWQAIERLTSCFRFPNHRSDPVPRFLVPDRHDAQEVFALEFDEFWSVRRVVGVSSYRSDDHLELAAVATLSPVPARPLRNSAAHSIQGLVAACLTGVALSDADQGDMATPQQSTHAHQCQRTGGKTGEGER